MKKQKLTVKQKKFADEYIKTGNATKSALAAGYNSRTAYRTGADNLKKPQIKFYISEQLKKIEDHKIMGAKEALERITQIARGESVSKQFFTEGKELVLEDVPPTTTEVFNASREILKRYPLSEMDKAEIRKAQAEAVQAETNAKLARQQIQDHDTASGQVMKALKDMPREEIIRLARKLGGEQNAQH